METPKRGRPPLIPGSRIVQVAAYLSQEVIKQVEKYNPDRPFRVNLREIVSIGLGLPRPPIARKRRKKRRKPK